MTPQDVDGTEQPAHKLRWLWVVLAIMLAAVAVGTLWWWKANQKPAASCNPKDLSLSIGETEQTEATNYIHAVITNNGKTPCTVEGYPIVSALDSKGENTVVTAAQTNPYFTSRVVTLEPRGQAYAAVGIPKAENFIEGMCSNMTATLTLYLPDDTLRSAPLTANFAHKICPGFSVTVFIAGS